MCVLGALVTVVTVVLIARRTDGMVQSDHWGKLGGQESSFLYIHQFFLARSGPLLTSLHSLPFHPSVLEPHLYLQERKMMFKWSYLSIQKTNRVQNFSSSSQSKKYIQILLVSFLIVHFISPYELPINMLSYFIYQYSFC